MKDITAKLLRDQGVTTATAASPKIHRTVLIDREVDLITPMCTQITFEGLIDEVVGINYASVPLQSRDKKGAEGEGRKAGATILLNSTDPFYREFRDLPYYITSLRSAQVALLHSIRSLLYGGLWDLQDISGR